MREGDILVSHRATAKLHEECLVSKYLYERKLSEMR